MLGRQAADECQNATRALADRVAALRAAKPSSRFQADGAFCVRPTAEVASRCNVARSRISASGISLTFILHSNICNVSMQNDVKT